MLIASFVRITVTSRPQRPRNSRSVKHNLMLSAAFFESFLQWNPVQNITFAFAEVFPMQKPLDRSAAVRLVWMKWSRATHGSTIKRFVMRKAILRRACRELIGAFGAAPAEAVGTRCAFCLRGHIRLSAPAAFTSRASPATTSNSFSSASPIPVCKQSEPPISEYRPLRRSFTAGRTGNKQFADATHPPQIRCI